MKAIVTVVVYLCSSRVSRQMYEDCAIQLDKIITQWQEKLSYVNIIHLIIPVERDTEVDIRLLAPGNMTKEDQAILKGFKNLLMSNVNDRTINDAKSFYE